MLTARGVIDDIYQLADINHTLSAVVCFIKEEMTVVLPELIDIFM